jgi:hypothetical protein
MLRASRPPLSRPPPPPPPLLPVASRHPHRQSDLDPPQRRARLQLVRGWKPMCDLRARQCRYSRLPSTSWTESLRRARRWRRCATRYPSATRCPPCTDLDHAGTPRPPTHDPVDAAIPATRASRTYFTTRYPHASADEGCHGPRGEAAAGLVLEPATQREGERDGGPVLAAASPRDACCVHEAEGARPYPR